MKRNIALLILGLLFVAIGYYVYEIYPFAKGVQDDTKKRIEFIKKERVKDTV